MKIVVTGGEKMKMELLSEGLKDGVEMIWTEDPAEMKNADACIHFGAGISVPETFNLISSVIDISKQLPAGSVRFNGWPGFLAGKTVEMFSENTDDKRKAEEIFSSLNKKIEWVKDIPGFISGRVVSMIINEAFFALEEKVSSKEEIDIAMKLGTNYPFGPFEWAEKIGLKNIFDLLSSLAKEEDRYIPAPLLKAEALHS